MDKGHMNEANDIVDDVIENEKKIIYHGKRAGSIVRGMLRHSQSGAGKKELTNINALADEYLRLAYHGFRAADNSFNVLLKTNYAEYIEKININPQDIGRVLLNLYNNAFYEVNEKNKEHIPGYEPTVSVMTRKNERKIEIRVIDNGKGIAKKLMDKVFQPFFTTKPAGQGTGLGLSLSYDIVKAHGGELTVETNEENRTEFMIRIPIN